MVPVEKREYLLLGVWSLPKTTDFLQTCRVKGSFRYCRSSNGRLQQHPMHFPKHFPCLHKLSHMPMSFLPVHTTHSMSRHKLEPKARRAAMSCTSLGTKKTQLVLQLGIFKFPITGDLAQQKARNRRSRTPKQDFPRLSLERVDTLNKTKDSCRQKDKSKTPILDIKGPKTQRRKLSKELETAKNLWICKHNLQNTSKNSKILFAASLNKNQGLLLIHTKGIEILQPAKSIKKYSNLSQTKTFGSTVGKMEHFKPVDQSLLMCYHSQRLGPYENKQVHPIGLKQMHQQNCTPTPFSSLKLKCSSAMTSGCPRCQQKHHNSFK